MSNHAANLAICGNNCVSDSTRFSERGDSHNLFGAENPQGRIADQNEEGKPLFVSVSTKGRGKQTLSCHGEAPVLILDDRWVG